MFIHRFIHSRPCGGPASGNYKCPMRGGDGVLSLSFTVAESPSAARPREWAGVLPLVNRLRMVEHHLADIPAEWQFTLKE